MNKQLLYFVAAAILIYIISLQFFNRDESIVKTSKLLTIDDTGNMIFTPAEGIFDYADEKATEVGGGGGGGVSSSQVQTSINDNYTDVIEPAIRAKAGVVQTAAASDYVLKTTFNTFKGTGGYLEDNFLKKSTPYGANITNTSGSDAALFSFS